jgi:hypothetical protein
MWKVAPLPADLGPDPSAVRLDDGAGDRQPEAAHVDPGHAHALTAPIVFALTYRVLPPGAARRRRRGAPPAASFSGSSA